MATQTLSRVPQQLVGNKTRAGHIEQTNKRTELPLYIPPNEFRMKLLKRILSVDGTIDNKALHKLQKTSSDRTLQANIVFQNGDVGTLISFDRSESRENDDNDAKDKQELPVLQQENERVVRPKGENRERPLKLPPIMLQPVYTLTPRPLMVRDFSGPPTFPPPLTEDDWEDLEDCRYLRHAKKQFGQMKQSKSFLK